MATVAVGLVECQGEGHWRATVVVGGVVEKK